MVLTSKQNCTRENNPNTYTMSNSLRKGGGVVSIKYLFKNFSDWVIIDGEALTRSSWSTRAAISTASFVCARSIILAWFGSTVIDSILTIFARIAGVTTALKRLDQIDTVSGVAVDAQTIVNVILTISAFETWKKVIFICKVCMLYYILS